MTETAKQDTTKAPAQPKATKPEETESAATESATPTAGTGAADNEAGEADKPDLDETKRKFREALERKNHAHNDGQDKGGKDHGKIDGAHGPAASRRNFRRKSG
jgi:hypothetical protein